MYLTLHLRSTLTFFSQFSLSIFLFSRSARNCLLPWACLFLLPPALSNPYCLRNHSGIVVSKQGFVPTWWSKTLVTGLEEAFLYPKLHGQRTRLCLRSCLLSPTFQYWSFRVQSQRYVLLYVSYSSPPGYTTQSWIHQWYKQRQMSCLCSIFTIQSSLCLSLSFCLKAPFLFNHTEPYGCLVCCIN